MSLASQTDEMLMEQVDAIVQRHRANKESIELSTILLHIRGIEERRLPFDIAIEAVLNDCVRSGNDLWSASETLISNYPDFKEQISHAVLISTLLDDSGHSHNRFQHRDPPQEIGPLLGDGVRRRYELVVLCGEGASGRTFKAIDRLLSDEYGTSYAALKLFDVLGSDAEAIGALLAEANRASSIHHANVVQVRDRGSDRDGWAYIAMEYIPGGTLSDWAPQSEEEFLGVSIQIADGLRAIHSGGIIHSDLKPQNIMLFEDENGSLTPKLTDFGVSRVIEQYELNASGDPYRGAYGNIAFQSPEVYGRGERQSVSSDIYALGAMLHYMATGVLLHQERVHEEGVSPRSSSDLQLSRRLRMVLDRACSGDPELRQKSCAELADQLRSVRDHRPIPGFDSRVHRAWIWGRRHPVAASMLLLALILGPIVAAGATQAREGWAYERGKREVASQVFRIDEKIRPALSARDTVYDLLDSYMIRQLIRDETALAWLSEAAQEPTARLHEMESALEAAQGSPVDELLIREQLVLHSLQDRADHPGTTELISVQRDSLERAGLMTGNEAEQIRLFEAVDATKRAVLARSHNRPWQSERLRDDLDVMLAFIMKRTDSQGSLTTDARRDPRVRLALRAAEWLSSPKLLDDTEVHDRLKAFYLGED